jgi:type I restriction enzyme S subunit
VGIIPEDWEDIKIKDIVKVSQGLQIAIDDRFTTPAHNRVFYITIPFIEGKKEEYIENPKSSTLCKKDDILVVRTGSGVGKIIRGVEGAFHNNFFKVKPSDNINIDFFYYFLTSPRVQFLMAKYAGNSAIPDLNHGDFYSLDFLIPPLKEQEKIAEIITTWDEAITKQTELLRAKELQKKGLMQKLLSGEVRFDGFSDEWEEVKIKDIFEITRGYVLAVTEMSQEQTAEYKYPVYSSQTKNNGLTGYYKDYLFENCITWTTDGANAGDVNLRKGKFYCTNVCGVLKSDKGYANQCIAEILNLVTKNYVSYVGNPKLMNNTMGGIKIKIPKSLPEQQKIAEVLSLADDEINLLKNELEELKLQKKALMQKLLTGQVRVKV